MYVQLSILPHIACSELAHVYCAFTAYTELYSLTMLEQSSWIRACARSWVEGLVLRLCAQGINALEYLMHTPRSHLPAEQRYTVQADLCVSSLNTLSVPMSKLTS